MKTIVYTAVYQSPKTGAIVDRVEVYARDINAGFAKASRYALSGMPKGWEMVSLTFTEVVG